MGHEQTSAKTFDFYLATSTTLGVVGGGFPMVKENQDSPPLTHTIYTLDARDQCSLRAVFLLCKLKQRENRKTAH